MFLFLVISIIVLLYFVYNKLQNGYKYWEKRNIKGPKPHWLIGNSSDMFNKSYGLRRMIINFYDRYPDEKYVGFYIGLQPALIVKDLNSLKKIYVQDFSSFINRGIKVTDGPLSKNLFDADGDEWRILRKILSPIFTSGKLKLFMPIMNTCVNEFIQYLDQGVKENPVQEMKDVILKYTTKSIISIAFGLDVNTFSNEKHDLIKWVDGITEESGKLGFQLLLDSIIPGLSEKIITRTDRKVSKFFLNFSKEIIQQREGKPKLRNDFIDLMIKIKEEGVLKNNTKNSTGELQITDELIAAQACTMYVGGLETSAGAASFMCYELALNPEIQENCYREIKKALEKNNFTLDYDSLKELSYLSMVFDETLRKYPIGAENFRVAENKYTFPETNLTIDKGTKIIIPIYKLHNDPKYFPNPEKFDPERFSPENKHKIQEFTYMPFGEGLRNCIGSRLAKMQSMLVLAHLLYKYRMEKNEKTPKEIRFSPTMLVLTHVDGLWLTLKHR